MNAIFQKWIFSENQNSEPASKSWFFRPWIYQNWFHGKSEWQKNHEISSLCGRVFLTYVDVCLKQFDLLCETLVWEWSSAWDWTSLSTFWSDKGLRKSHGEICHLCNSCLQGKLVTYKRFLWVDQFYITCYITVTWFWHIWLLQIEFRFWFRCKIRIGLAETILAILCLFQCYDMIN